MQTILYPTRRSVDTYTAFGGRVSELYMETSIAGLWNAVNNNQRVATSSTDGGRLYYLRPACEALVDVESRAGGRVQVFANRHPSALALMSSIMLYAESS
jgi:hypothetical protein